MLTAIAISCILGVICAVLMPVLPFMILVLFLIIGLLVSTGIPVGFSFHSAVNIAFNVLALQFGFVSGLFGRFVTSALLRRWRGSLEKHELRSHAPPKSLT